MDKSIKKVFDEFPKPAREKLLTIRNIIFNVAEAEGIDNLEEQLKWGEPSYISKFGSAVRLTWKEKYPDKVFICFNCNTRLVHTFKEVYGSVLEFEGKRAIILDLNKAIPQEPLMHCISLSLRYKKLKKLPLLGI